MPNNDTTLKAIAIISILSGIIGIIGNLISIIICSQKDLRKTPTFILKIFISIMNLIPMLTNIFSPFAAYFLNSKYDDLSFTIFKMLIFLVFWSFQSTAYLEVTHHFGFGYISCQDFTFLQT